MGGRFVVNSRILFEYTAISLDLCTEHQMDHL